MQTEITTTIMQVGKPMKKKTAETRYLIKWYNGLYWALFEVGRTKEDAQDKLKKLMQKTKMRKSRFQIVKETITRTIED